MPEYLVFDPTGRFPRPPCRAWRLAGGARRAWRPESDGCYVSHALGIALRPDGDLLRVYDAQGRPVPYDYEKAGILETQAQELETQAREIEELRAELACLHAQVPAPAPSPASDEDASALAT